MPTLKLEANNMIKKKFSLSQKSPAQAMVEFALVLPILLLVIYGLLEVGRLIFIYSSAVSAARQAVRYGATTGLNVSGGVPRYNDCTGMRAAAKRVGFIDRIEDADIEIWNDEGEGVSQVSYCAPGSTTDTSFEPSTGNISRIRVQVSTVYTPIVPLVPFTGYTISSISARTILVSVPIVVDAPPEGWDPGDPPLPPGDFTKISPSNGAIDQETSVTLTWEPSADATSYDVCYDTTNNNTCAPWAGNGSSTSIQISGLATDTTYYWHVRAVNASGTTYSNAPPDTTFWSFTTSASTCFTKADPLSFAPAPGSTKGFWTIIYNKSGFDITMSNITITWDDSGSQKIKYLLFGSIRIDVSGNQTQSPVTIPNVNIIIPANGSVPLEVYFEDPYQDGSATTEEIVVNFSTSGCSALAIQ